MKKITIITMQLKTPGGIERFVSTLSTMFNDNYEVEIVANYGRPNDPLAFPLSSNIKLTFLSPVQPKEVSLKDLITKFQWHKIPAELKRRRRIYRIKDQVFQKYLSALKTDYIITDRAEYNYLVQKFYSGSAIKIATDHNFHQNNHQYIKQLITSLQGFSYLVVATKELQKFYQPLLPDVKCLFIPNPLASIPAKKSSLTAKNLLSVGRFVAEKDFPTLINVMNKVHDLDPSIRLTLIGDGPDMPNTKHLVKKLNLQKVISLPGFLPQDQISRYYYNSSLFVMTSVTEAFGLVLAEAMSYGLPCIAFDRASGARAQINSRTGILIKNANVDAMASAIVFLLDNPAKLQQYQTNIVQSISELNIDRIAKLWHQVVK